MGKRTKGQDRDKYYYLAKDQGYRARSAFKLIEINKRFDFLGKAKVLVDLCAAPGGWCQVAAKHMPKDSIILGVDLLPIRPIRNVKTLISDITTDECRSLIKKELKTWRADVVLCDGAPNVGAAYVKDAYVQNEIALAALKVATQHLIRGGTFVTKVYRSQDYNALIWTLQQFFDSHQAVKPASSRSQSAEIFVVGVGYKDPDHIDPRLLDPKFVFDQGYEEGLGKSVNVFHKKYDQHNKKNRSGYDASLGQLLTSKATVTEFIEAESPVKLMSQVHVFEFSEACAVFKENEHTTPEILQCCSDLRLLGKSEFKSLLKWRLKMIAYRESLKHANEDSDGSGNENGGYVSEKKPSKTDAEIEEEIQTEIKDLRLKVLAEKKRSRKKEREAAAKLRQKIAMGIEACNIETEDENVGIFSLATIGTNGEIDALRDVDLSKVSSRSLGLDSDESDDDSNRRKNKYEELDKEEISARIEEELNQQYYHYLERTKNPEAREGTRLAKRAKKAIAQKAANEEMEDTLLYDENQEKYYEMLDGPKDSDSDRSSEDDGYFSESDTEKSARTELETGESRVPGGGLLTDLIRPGDIDNSKQAIANRWFGNELFKDIGDAFDDDEDEDADINENEIIEKEITNKKISEKILKNTKKNKELPAEKKFLSKWENKLKDKNLTSEDPEISGEAAISLGNMPKTDKQIRKEKRKKDTERKEQKDSKRVRGLDIEESMDIDIVAGDETFDSLDERAKVKIMKARELIAAGMGNTVQSNTPTTDDSFEIAPAEAIMVALKGKDYVLSRNDERQYISEEEDYDDDDRAKQLALGTMMIRKHRAKEIVDAAYNRYSWNDPKNLPEWFTDDERRHYRPQIPIAPELIQQMKEKFINLSSKPIKKVAEARSRKRKRASIKLKAAKKKANTLASNPDMSDRQKLKVIQSALKKGVLNDKPTKSYVVAKKFHGGKPSTSGKKKGSKIKFVDSRMRSDTRSMKRAAAKKGGKSGGKKGGKRK